MRMLISLAILLGLSGPSFAGEVLECAIRTTKGTQGTWIAPEMLVAFDMDGLPVQVFDGIVNEFNKGKPIAAKIASKDARSLSFEWAMFLVNSAGQRTKMQYRATYFLASGEIAVSARPIGYADFFTARGNCKPASP